VKLLQWFSVSAHPVTFFCSLLSFLIRASGEADGPFKLGLVSKQEATGRTCDAYLLLNASN